jgi:hypothetical protein
MSAPSHADRKDAASTLDPEQLEVAPGTVHDTVAGWIPQLATDEELRLALEKAFDYRGDVTITRKDGGRVEGYIFDRVSASSLSASFVRLLPRDSNQRLTISYADIAALAFSERDPAAGKSWEAWVRKYWEKKASGTGGASLQPEALD